MDYCRTVLHHRSSSLRVVLWPFSGPMDVHGLGALCLLNLLPDALLAVYIRDILQKLLDEVFFDACRILRMLKQHYEYFGQPNWTLNETQRSSMLYEHCFPFFWHCLHLNLYKVLEAVWGPEQSSSSSSRQFWHGIQNFRSGHTIGLVVDPSGRCDTLDRLSHEFDQLDDLRVPVACVHFWFGSAAGSLTLSGCSATLSVQPDIHLLHLCCVQLWLENSLVFCARA